MGLADNVEQYFAKGHILLARAMGRVRRVVLEAMGLGLPVICSDRVGAAEIFEGESRDLIFPSGDQERFTTCLLRLVEDIELRRRVGVERDTASRYSENVGAKLIALLEKHRII